MRRTGGVEPAHFGLGGLIFAAAMLFSILPAAPLTSDLNGLFGTPMQGPLIVAWVASAVVSSGWLRGVGLAAVLIAVGAITALLGGDADVLRAWVGAVVLPLLIFVGIQSLPSGRLHLVRSGTRFALFVACVLQAYYYVSAVGVAAALSPSFVIGHHTDILLWEDVGGRVLANPTNASVIFCTAFAWAVCERAIGSPGRFSWLFVAVSGAAVWVTGSRGAYLTAGLVLVGAAMFHARTRRRAAAMLIAFVGIAYAFHYWSANFAAGARTGDSLSARLETRAAAVPVILERPFGYGPGMTAEALRPHLHGVSFLGVDTTGATSHDLFLNWGVCLGWVGLLLLLGALWVAVRNTLRGHGMLALAPLLAFLVAGESTGVDILNSTNAAWATVLWALIGLSFRGGILARPAVEDAAAASERPGELHERGTGDRAGRRVR